MLKPEMVSAPLPGPNSKTSVSSVPWCVLSPAVSVMRFFFSHRGISSQVVTLITIPKRQTGALLPSHPPASIHHKQVPSKSEVEYRRCLSGSAATEREFWISKRTARRTFSNHRRVLGTTSVLGRRSSAVLNSENVWFTKLTTPAIWSRYSSSSGVRAASTKLYWPVLRRRLELAVKKRLASGELQRLLDVMPFKRPHQRAGPHVDGKAAAEDRPRPGNFAVMQERCHLRNVDRLVRYEHVRQGQLQSGTVGMAPFRFAYDVQHGIERLRPHRGTIAQQVAQGRPAVLVPDEGEVQVEGAFHFHVAAFKTNNRRTTGDGFGMALVDPGGTHPARGVVDHPRRAPRPAASQF